MTWHTASGVAAAVAVVEVGISVGQLLAGHTDGALVAAAVAVATALLGRWCELRWRNYLAYAMLRVAEATVAFMQGLADRNDIDPEEAVAAIDEVQARIDRFRVDFDVMLRG